jgi:hypothetical protein
VDAVWRLRRTRDDVGSIQRKARERAEAAGEKDKKKLEELPLVKAGDTLKEDIDALEKKLWQAPEVKGLLPDTDVLSRIGYAGSYVGSSWAPPSPTHLLYLRQAEEAVQAVLTALNQEFEAKVTAYRKQATDAGLGLLPVNEPLRLAPPGN